MAADERQQAIAALGYFFLHSTPDDYTTEELIEMVRRQNVAAEQQRRDRLAYTELDEVGE